MVGVSRSRPAPAQVRAESARVRNDGTCPVRYRTGLKTAPSAHGHRPSLCRTASGMTDKPRTKRESGGVLVLGGTGGLGAAIVRRLATDWEHLEFTFRPNGARRRGIGRGTGDTARVQSHGLDYLDEAALGAVVRAVHHKSGGLRAVVERGGRPIDPVWRFQLTPEQWQSVVPIELMGFIALVRQVLPILRVTRGSIVNVGSVAELFVVVGDARRRTKAGGAEVLCRAVAKEEAPRCTREHGGAGHHGRGIGKLVMETTYDGAVWEQSRRRTPLRRFGLARTSRRAVAFLWFSEASFITGQTIIADGGLHL